MLALHSPPNGTLTRHPIFCLALRCTLCEQRLGRRSCIQSPIIPASWFRSLLVVRTGQTLEQLANQLPGETGRWPATSVELLALLTRREQQAQELLVDGPQTAR